MFSLNAFRPLSRKSVTYIIIYLYILNYLCRICTCLSYILLYVLIHVRGWHAQPNRCLSPGRRQNPSLRDFLNWPRAKALSQSQTLLGTVYYDVETRHDDSSASQSLSNIEHWSQSIAFFELQDWETDEWGFLCFLMAALGLQNWL